MKNPNFNYTAPPEGGALPQEISYFKGGSGYDSQEYKSLALNILKHHRFSWNSEPVTFRLPGYPLLIAAIYSLFGIKDWVVMLFQLLLSTATIYLIYLIGRKVGNELSGIVGASLFSIDFGSILFSSLFMSETLFVFFVLVGTLLFLMDRKTQWCVPTSGFVFGLSVLIRPIALYIFVPLVLLHLIAMRKQHPSLISYLQKQAFAPLLFLFLFFLPILPWMARNYKIYHLPLLTSSQGFNLLFLHATLVESEEQCISIEKVQHEFSKELSDSLTNPLKLASLAQRIGIKRIMQSPLRYAFICLKSGGWILLSTKSDDIIMRLFGTPIVQSNLLIALTSEKTKIVIPLLAGVEVLVVICSIILAFISFIRSPGRPNLLFFLMGIYFFIVSVPLGESRYRLPLIPFVYLLASQWLKRR